MRHLGSMIDTIISFKQRSNFRMFIFFKSARFENETW